MTTIAVIVDWYGPFAAIDDANDAAQEFEEVLYLAVGKLQRQRNTRLQYVGISKDPQHRLTRDHRKLSQIRSDLGVWIGAVSSQRVAGRPARGRPVGHSRALGLSEWMIAYFLRLPLNEKKRSTAPREAVIVMNRWFKPNKTRWTKRAHKGWPDFIEFDPSVKFARLQWFGSPGKIERLNAGAIEALAG